MKNRKILIAIFTFVLAFFIAACESSFDDSSDASNSQSQNNKASQSKNEDSTDTDDSNAENNNNADTNDTSNDTPAKETDQTGVSLKEQYLQKLTDIKKETEELKATDSSTYALKKVANDRWEIWDDLLNEIYGVLKERLSPEEMAQLRDEQRNWIKERDDSALEASEKFKGGTQEQLEYVAVLANLTEERCHELVENYMR
jgi:uncharacterized protein YecT (DUF1311 family)